MNKLIVFAEVFFIATVIVSAQNLKTYKAAYEKCMKEITQSYDIQMTELGKQYTKALDILLSKTKKAGDWDKATAVMNEIKRFREKNIMPEKPAVFIDIQNVQMSFTKYASTYETEKAKKILRAPFTVTKHRAAIRPIIRRSQIVMGTHPSHSKVAFFNGLGSKGVLNGPYYASRLCDHLLNGADIPEHLDLQRNF